MSKFVDERVVEMSFDNKKFESNVKTSMGTIDRLKDSLNFSGTANKLSREFSGIDTNGLSSAILSVKNNFGLFEIAAITAIANITNKIVDLGIQFVKSLSFDQISAGFSKFAETAKSEATLLTQGYSQLAVTDAIEKLLWFTDETSYSFIDMMSNMSKFTAAGVELEQAQNAMMGIANWAALSGQNAEVASRVMYQLSQAMGSGVVKLNDWRSVETANMATAEFKDMILETAVAMGTLTKTVDGSYVTLSGKKFEAGKFRDFLSEGFLTTEVLTTTLEAYSKVAMEVQKMMQDDSSIRTASQGIKVYEQQINDLEASYGPLITDTQKLEIASMRFGVRAFKAAQEARTFSDSIKAVKDAVSTGWTRIFTKLFGQVEEAKKLWTDLAASLYDVFMGGIWKKIDVLSIWADNGGRNDLFDNTEESTGAFWNLFNAIIAIKDLISGAWNKVFGFSQLEDYNENVSDIATKLKELTANLKEWTSKLFLSESATETLTNILSGLFSILKIVGKTVIAVAKGFSPIVDVLKVLAGYILGLFGNAGKELTVFANTSSIFGKITSNMQNFFNTIITFVKNLDLLKGAKIFVDAFGKALRKVTGDTGSNVKKISVFKTVINALSSAFKWLGDVLNKYVVPILPKFFDLMGSSLGWLVGQISKLFSKIAGLVARFKEWIKTNRLFQNGIDQLKKALDGLGAFFKRLVVNISEFFKSFSKSDMAPVDDFTGEVTKKFTPLQTFIKGLSDLFQGLWHVISAIVPVIGGFFTFIGKALTTIGDKLRTIFRTSEGDLDFEKIFSVGFWAVMTVGILRFASSLRSITQVFKDSMDSVFGFFNSRAMKQYMDVIKTMTISILLMVGALLILGSMDDAALKKSMLALSGLVAFILGTMILMKVLFAASNTITGKGKNKQITGTSFNLVGVAAAFIGLGLAILLMATSLKMLSAIEPEALKKGLKSLGVMFTMIIAVLVLASLSENETNKAVGSLVKMALSINMLILPLRILGTMDPAVLARGLFFMGILMAIVAGYSRLSKAMDKSQKPVISLLGIAWSLTLLIIPLLVIGNMKFLKILQALGVIAVVMGLVVGISKIMKLKDANRLKVVSKSMIEISSSLILFGIAMLVIGLSSWWTILKSLAMIVGVFAALVGLSKFITKPRANNLVIVLNMLGKVSRALIVFGLAMLVIGSVGWDRMKIALISIGVLFVYLGALSKMLTKANATNLGKTLSVLIPMSLALVVFGVAMTVLGSLSFGSTMTSLAAIAAIMGILAGMGFLMSKGLLKPIQIMLLAGALAVMSIALLMFAPAIVAFSLIPWQSLVTGLVMMAAVFLVLFVASKLLDPVILTLLGFALSFVAIAAGIYLLIAAFALLLGVIDVAPGAVSKVFNSIVSAIGGFFSNLGKSIGDGFKNVVNGIGSWVKDIMAKISGGFGGSSEVGKNLVDGLWNGIKNAWTTFTNWISTKTQEITLIFTKKIEDLKDIGRRLIEGLVDGLKNAGTAIKDAVTGVANNVVGWFKNIFGIKSPSKVFAEMGNYLDLGLAKGINDNTGVAYDAAKALGDDTAEGMEKSGLSKVLSDLNTSLESDFSNEIVIRPVLDLSEIQNGKNKILNMMNGSSIEYSVDGSNSLATKTRDEINKDTRRSAEDITNSKQNPGISETTYNTFNIKGSNPKEIADEISKLLQDQVNRRKAKWAL